METPSYQAVFFDLDGTLLPLELDVFLRDYFKAITAFAAQQGFDGQRFSLALNAGIKAMAHHDGGVTNCDVFWDAFGHELGNYGPDDRARVEAFYGDPFGAIGRDVVPNPAAARAVDTLAEKGYRLVLATMPLFPLQAIEWRLKWAGVDPSRFERITTYDNSTAVKPQLDYYRQNLDALGLSAQDVLMVGNNTDDDLSAMDLGIDGYLVCDHLINENGFDIETVPHGSLADFADEVANWPECRS